MIFIKILWETENFEQPPTIFLLFYKFRYARSHILNFWKILKISGFSLRYLGFNFLRIRNMGEKFGKHWTITPMKRDILELLNQHKGRNFRRTRYFGISRFHERSLSVAPSNWPQLCTFLSFPVIFSNIFRKDSLSFIPLMGSFCYLWWWFLQKEQAFYFSGFAH